MHSYIFSSPYLKYKNDKLYLLNNIDKNSKNYEEQTYFIDFNEIIIKKNIKINDIELEYDIIFYENDKNLLVKFDTLKDINEKELNKIIYSIEKNISGFDDNYIDEEDNYISKKYSNTYIKI
jgi:hypothetical protein